MLSSLKPKTSNFQARQSILRHGMCFNYNFVFSCNREKSFGFKYNVILNALLNDSFAGGVNKKDFVAKSAVHVFFVLSKSSTKLSCYVLDKTLKGIRVLKLDNQKFLRAPVSRIKYFKCLY